ncbi:MAG TPA: sulfatase-like hydrolase/transferase [Pirellulales bacterium]|nr:sulfatase-like hydrolase/transferase [Pirellulales bacterium]
MMSHFLLRGLLGAGLLAMLLLTSLPDVLQAEAASRRQPNIVVIVADDLGWGDVGFHGAALKTPHLDQLAREGTELRQHYVAPVCSPTRAAFNSGRYWSRFGVTTPNNERAFRFDTVTLAGALKAVGYRTALTGKWHLGSMPQWGPSRFGFDHSYGSLAGGCGPYDHRYKTGPCTHTWHRDDRLIEEEGHITDLIAREAVRWIEDQTEAPFFLYVPFTAVHIPVDEPQRWLDLYPDIAGPSRRQYAACVSHLDDAVGRIVEVLARTGRRRQTLLVFFSDNGGYPTARNDDPLYPDGGKYVAGPAGGSNVPLRGKKTELYEGGIRVPALVNWPGTLEPRRATAPIHVVDWMPTLCSLAGYQPDGDLKWDGEDIWPVLTGAVAARPRELYWAGPGHRTDAVRQGDWKLIVHRKPEAPPELFNLAQDPNEQANLTDEQPQRVAALKQLLARLAERDNDALADDTEPE